jgi:hypothetical protein
VDPLNAGNTNLTKRTYDFQEIARHLLLAQPSKEVIYFLKSRHETFEDPWVTVVLAEMVENTPTSRTSSGPLKLVLRHFGRSSAMVGSTL